MEPVRPTVQLPSLTDEIPLDTMWNQRAADRLDAEWEALGGVSVDLSEEGLAQSAEGGRRMGDRKITPPSESTSEQVRDRATTALAEGPVRKGVDTVLRTLTGLGLDEVQEAITRGALPEKVSLKLLDPAGNVAEELVRTTAKESGLDDETAGKVGIAAGMLFGMAAGWPKGKAAKALAEGAKGTNVARVTATADVKTVIKNLNEFNAARLAGHRAKMTHAETIAASQGLPKVKEGFTRLFRAETSAGFGPYAADMPPGQGLYFTTSLERAQGMAADAPAGTGRVVYLDVPTADAARYEKRVGVLPNALEEHVVPLPIAAARRPIGGSPILTLDEALRLSEADLLLDAAQQTALRDHYNSAATYLTDVAKRAVAGDQQAVNEMYTAFTIAGELAAKDESIGRNVARSLESRKILSEAERAPLELHDLSALASMLQGTTMMDPTLLAQRLLTLNATQRKVMAQHSVSLLRAGQNALYEAWINGLLSGPQTHAANMLSNTLTAAWAPAERFLAAGLDVDALGGKRSVYFGESVAMLYGVMEGMKDGIRLAGKTMREGTSGFGSEKIERVNAITTEAFHLNPEGVVGGAVDVLGAIVRAPGRALMTEDAFFKAVNYRMELRALAYREAAQEGLSGSAFWQRMREIVQDPPPAVKERATEAALIRTFNQEVCELGRVGQIGKAATTMAEALPMGRLVLPFICTPTNILHYASERTPVLSLISDTVRADFKAGGERRAMALAKMSGGFGVSAVIATVTASAINPEAPTPYMTMITGEGPRDKRMRAQLETMGWKPYSVWNPISKEYISYRRTDPLGTIFGIVSSATEILGQLDEVGVQEVVTAAGIATSKAMLSKTFLTGLSDFLDSMEGNPEDINRFFNGLARSGVPAGLRQVTRTLDPIRKDVETLYDHWRSGLPGYDGPAVHNLWGDPIMLPAGVGPDLISPLYSSAVTPDATTEWLVQNKVALSRTPRAIGSAVAGGTPYIRTEAEKPVKLTKEERQRLAVLMGKGGDAPDIGSGLGPLAGQAPLKDALARFIAGPGTDGPGGSRADLILSFVNQRRAMAIDQLRRESPLLDEELTRREKERVQQKIPGAALTPTLTR